MRVFFSPILRVVHLLFIFHSLYLDAGRFIFIMQESWTRILSFALLFVFALQAEALPKKKATTSQTSTSSGTKAAAASGGVTTATDGSMILDKTVQIK